mmetsp:Transcript_70362/g.187488  ORF Transcript_70362/g.187488 Transcript_70362/m.187488 type:complete len:294 (-) Transcript_70362:238-1119(-)
MDRYSSQGGMQLMPVNDPYASGRSSKYRPTREEVLYAPLDYRSMIGNEKRVGQDKIVATQAIPVVFEKKAENRQYLNSQIIAPNKAVTLIDKRVDRIVEVIREAPFDKVVEATKERLQVTEKVQERPGTTVYEEHPRVEERVRHVPVERTVYKEAVQEVVIDKVVEVLVEVLRVVEVPRIVERRVEIIQEVPSIRYVDRVVSREVPMVRVVERKVEVIKEVPVEVIKEVPIYVKNDVTNYEERDRVATAGTGGMMMSGSYGGMDSQMYGQKRVSVGPELHVMDRSAADGSRRR